MKFQFLERLRQPPTESNPDYAMTSSCLTTCQKTVEKLASNESFCIPKEFISNHQLVQQEQDGDGLTSKASGSLGRKSTEALRRRKAAPFDIEPRELIPLPSPTNRNDPINSEGYSNKLNSSPSLLKNKKNAVSNHESLTAF